MNKRLLLCFVTFTCVSSLYANLNYQFDAISLKPLHKEYYADRTREDLSVSYLYYLDGYPDRVLQDEKIDPSIGEVNKVSVWKFDGDIEPKDKMVEVKLGETMAIGRSTLSFNSFLSPIAFDLSMQGVLQSFYRGSFDDNIGYDGIYFLGPTIRIGNFISIRYGLHHYCSHYGDATIKRIYENTIDTNPNFSDEFWMTYKYVRMNDKSIGISIEPSTHIRVYGELLLPQEGMSIRPDMFAPNWVTRNGVAINPDYPDSYKARIVNVGFEINYPIFKKLGITTIGYDLHLYEEGKVIYDHVNGGEITFDEDAPWEAEHDMRISQQLNKTVFFEVAYHNGRNPFNNFFFQQSKILSLSLRFNPESTINLINHDFFV